MAEVASELGDVLNSGEQVSTPTNITVYFAPAGATWQENGTTYQSSGWSQTEIDAALSALQQYSNVANLTFSQTTDANAATFHLGTYNIGDGAYGYFYLPTNAPEAGIGAFNHTDPSWVAGSTDQGGFTYNLFLHEFGHGLGLEHPHLDGTESSAFPGVTAPNSLGSHDLNQGIYTIMSYNEGWVTHPEGALPFNTYGYGYSYTPMAIDIAVLQEIYGANDSFASGNDIYQLVATNGTGTGYGTIWDTGGLDTIINTTNLNANIDLRPATLQTEIGGGGYVSFNSGIYGGYTIAYGVQIENATGGGGNDNITGNGANNILSGNGGNDIIIDALGNDLIDGGEGDDVLINGTGATTMEGRGGKDLMLGGNQSDTMNGGSGNDALRGDLIGSLFGGADIINGGTGDDMLAGGLGADSFIFKPGDGTDTIATFTHGDIATGQAMMVVATGADFTSGVDKIVLDGFSAAVANDPMAYVSMVNGQMVFSAEGTEITFFGVTGITSNDFSIL